jgi:hypothetical protein
MSKPNRMNMKRNEYFKIQSNPLFNKYKFENKTNHNEIKLITAYNSFKN